MKRRHLDHRGVPRKTHKKIPRESFDINGEPIRNYSPLQNHTQLLSRYVCFAGWADIDPDGNA